MSLGKYRVFATMLAVTAFCAFNDPGLESGAGAAVAEEAEEVHAASETGTEGVDGLLDSPEASEAQENASAGDYGQSSSRPADGDEV